MSLLLPVSFLLGYHEHTQEDSAVLLEPLVILTWYFHFSFWAHGVTLPFPVSGSSRWPRNWWWLISYQ